MMVESCLPGDDLDILNPYPSSLGICSNLNLSSSMSNLSIGSMHSPTDKESGANGARARHSSNTLAGNKPRGGSFKQKEQKIIDVDWTQNRLLSRNNLFQIEMSFKQKAYKGICFGKYVMRQENVSWNDRCSSNVLYIFIYIYLWLALMNRHYKCWKAFGNEYQANTFWSACDLRLLFQKSYSDRDLGLMSML